MWDSYLEHLPRRNCSVALRLEVLTPSASIGRRFSYDGSVTHLESGGRWISCCGRVKVYGAEAVRCGDLLEVRGALLAMPQDSYGRYCRSLGMRSRVMVSAILHSEPSTSLGARCRRRLERLRRRLAEALSEGICDEDAAGIYQAMIFGLRDSLPDRQVFVRSATIHLFSISGLHVMVFSLCLLKATSYLAVPHRWRVLLVLPVLLCYVLLSGGAPSALRAYLMMLSVSISVVSWRCPDSENALGFSALVLLVVNPYYLMNIGFLFSFVLVWVLLRSADAIKSACDLLCEKERWIPRSCRWIHLRYRLLRNWVLLPALTSLAAWLGSLGLTMHMNGIVPLGALPLNMAVGLFADLLVYAVIPKLLLAWTFPPLSRLLGLLLTPLLKLLYGLASLGAQPLFCHSCPKIGAGLLLFYYGALFLALCGFRCKTLRLGALLLTLVLGAWNATRTPQGMLLTASSCTGGPHALALTGSPHVLLQPGDKSAMRQLLDKLDAMSGARDLLAFVPDARNLNGLAAIASQGHLAAIALPPEIAEGNRHQKALDRLRAQGIAIHAENPAFLNGIRCDFYKSGPRGWSHYTISTHDARYHIHNLPGNKTIAVKSRK